MSAPTLPAHLGGTEQRVLRGFAAWLRQRFGARLVDLRLFGSRARGEGDEDSDLDVLAVIDGLRTAERQEVFDRIGDALTEHDVLLGGMTISADHWRDMHARELRIVDEIDRDGVPL